MTADHLNPKILEYLIKKTDLTRSTIRSTLSKLKRRYPSCTLNAVAQLFAISKGLSVMQKLTPDDKKTLPHNTVIKPQISIKRKPIRKKDKILELIKYDTKDYFIRGHIDEINKAYTKGCYTSTYLLARKIIENFIVAILSAKYPPDRKTNLEIYYDVSRRRIKDFGVVLKELYNRKKDFEFDKEKAIGRFYQLAGQFKKDANDKTHSWFHLVENRKEIDDLSIQALVELLRRIGA